MDSSSPFTFQSKLRAAVQKCTLEDPVRSEPEKVQIQRQEIECEGNYFNMNSNLMAKSETSQEIFFAFVSGDQEVSFVTLYIFNKETGSPKYHEFPPISQVVTAIQFGCLGCEIDKTGQQKVEEPTLLLIMGTKNGFIKILSFADVATFDSFQIETSPIVQLLCHDKINCFCYALLDNYKVLLVNLKTKQVIGHLHPIIITCDQSLSISLHHSGKYLLEATVGGYILVWKLPAELTKESAKKHKTYSVFPVVVQHQASIEGLVFCTFFGSLVAIITNDNLFKLLAIDTESSDFTVVMEYKIEGAPVRYAKIFEFYECLLVVKQDSNVEFLFFTPNLIMRESIEMVFRIDRQKRMNKISEVILSEDLDIILARSSHHFFIDSLKNLLKKKFNLHLQNNKEQRKI